MRVAFEGAMNAANPAVLPNHRTHSSNPQASEYQEKYYKDNTRPRTTTSF